VKGGTRGVVEALIHDADPHVTTRLVVRTGGHRRKIVPANAVATVDPAAKLLVVERPHKPRRPRTGRRRRPKLPSLPSLPSPAPVVGVVRVGAAFAAALALPSLRALADDVRGSLRLLRRR
jgi:hypothetical protein